MSEMSKEHDGKLRELCDDLKRWQGYYDPVDDKGQHEMFVRAADAVTELLALRKEREAAVPVACLYHTGQVLTRAECNDDKVFAICCKVETPLYATPPAQPVEVQVCPKCGDTGMADSGGVQPWGEPILIECDCTFPPAPSTDDDSLPFDPQIAEYEQMMEAELKAAAGAAYKVKSELSQLAEKLVRDTTALAATLSAETDTASQRFESLAGKAVGGWIACSERMPEKDGNYWAWWSESKRQGPAWFIKSELQAQFQSSEITHWMPLPEAPGKEG